MYAAVRYIRPYLKVQLYTVQYFKYDLDYRDRHDANMCFSHIRV
eukprot:SAG31_NODE_45757_length_257_cov_0.981013_1_plen_43_part_01